MANEFYYSVSLSIVHPSIDPNVITAAIPGLRPTISTMAGSESRYPDGTLRVPPRKAQLSHWLAELHEQERIYSADMPIAHFITTKVDELTRHRELFRQIRADGGKVAFMIGWWSIGRHSAETLCTETLAKCADIGVDLELNFYGP